MVRGYEVQGPGVLEAVPEMDIKKNKVNIRYSTAIHYELIASII